MTAPTGERLRIVVTGILVRTPLGGLSWHYMHYLLGLKALGHDVIYFEDSDDWEECCYDPSTHTVGPDPSFGLRWAGTVLEQVDFGDSWAYHDVHTKTWHGPLGEKARDFCRSADILLNVSGACWLRDWLRGIPRRVYVDTDPAFEQVRILTTDFRRELADEHNVFFTFGENLSTGTATCPDADRSWLATRQPIAMEWWPAIRGRSESPFTTVLQWDSYPTREYDGRFYGMKSHSFETVFGLPMRTSQPLELALAGVKAPRQRLMEGGWRIADALEVTRDPWSYRAYIQGSKAEFTIAKHGYVEGNTGWFSERSAGYLATGRPVITQSTGSPLPTGEGLLTFSSEDEAAAALDDVANDYARHCAAARELATEYFDAEHVLTRLLEQSSAGTLEVQPAI